MRWLVLSGLLLVSCLPPRSEPVAPVPEIFLDFPELAQWGHVVVIGAREYWRPDPALTAAGFRHVAWAPYANGYFYEDPADGLWWVSMDPWGFITEHYGFWRHHQIHGFVWRPFRPLQWHPFVATVLYDDRGQLLGMCPFFTPVWEAGLYDWGFGFDDSYWAAYWGGVHQHGFYAHHEAHLSHAWVSVIFYEADWHRRTEPDAHYRREREERQRRRPGAGRNPAPPPSGDRQREDQPEPVIVGEGLPARPTTSPPSPERGGEDGSPRPPAGLPTIPPRHLQPKRAAPARLPREALETRNLGGVETQRPARPEAAPPQRPVAAPDRGDPASLAIGDPRQAAASKPPERPAGSKAQESAAESVKKQVKRGTQKREQSETAAAEREKEETRADRAKKARTQSKRQD